MRVDDDSTEWKSYNQNLRVIDDLKKKLNHTHPKKRDQAQTELGNRPGALKPRDKEDEWAFERSLDQTR